MEKQRLLACRELHIDPAEAVVIGDSNGDMQMGRHAEVSYTLGYGPQLDQGSHLVDAHAIIRHYNEISVIL